MYRRPFGPANLRRNRLRVLVSESGSDQLSAFNGSVSTLATIGLSGPAVIPEGQQLAAAENDFSAIGYGLGRFNPTYRGGGLVKDIMTSEWFIDKYGRNNGITLGRNALVFNDRAGTYVHETMHVYQ